MILKILNKSKKVIFTQQAFFSQIKFNPYNNEIKNEILKEKNFRNFLKNLEIPIEIGKQLHQEIKAEAFFSKSMFFKAFAYEESAKWKKIFQEFYRAVYEEDFEYLEKKVEKNYVNLLKKFFHEIHGVNLKLELYEPEEQIWNIVFKEHKIFKGVFIERELNWNLDDYYIKTRLEKTTYELQKNKKAPKFLDYSQVKLLDNDLKFDYIDADRGSYCLNQYILEIQTNVKFLLATMHGDKLVYGNNDPDKFETHHIQLENKREYFQETPYFITDFDFILNRNPFIKNTL